MTVCLFRVDERLIHGQVVLGWARRLGIKQLIVVHDALAGALDEQAIYRCGLPADLRAVFWTLDQAAERLPEVIAGAEPALVLTGDVATMCGLARAGIPIGEVNIGGLHAGAGRRRVLPYVCLDACDEAGIRALEASGVRVTARDVPTTAPVRLTGAE